MLKGPFSWNRPIEISCYSYELFFQKPLRIQNQPLLSKKGLILKASQEKVVRYAECSPLPFLSKESLTQSQKELESFFIQNRYPPFFSPSTNFALTSLFFSPACPKKKWLCALVQGSFKEMDKALEKKAKEFSFIKIKYHPPIEEFTTWFWQVQKRYPSCLFRIDINQKWSSKEASYFLRKVPLKGIDYLEEPFRSWQELQAFIAKNPFPLSLDESLYEKKNPPFLKNLKAYTVKPSLLPLFFSYLNQEVPVVLSSSYESSIGLSNIACFSKGSLALGIDTFEIFSSDLLQTPLKKEKGYIFFPEIKLDEKQLCPLFTVLFFLPLKKSLEKRLFLLKKLPFPIRT